MVYGFFDKKNSATLAWSKTLAGSGIKNVSILNKELARKSHKLIIK